MVLKKTSLHALHIACDARMVPFAGYEMPVQYSLGVKKEHLHTRSRAGLFDISHMGQVKLSGDNVAQELEALIPTRIQDLAIGKQCYSVLLNDNGGIIDDLMITNAGDHLFIVINAACKENDIAHLREKLPSSCQLEELADHSLLALQGPEAANVMQRHCPEANELTFMTGSAFNINGIDCFINRCGYSGEDGFEISLPDKHCEKIASLLLNEDELELIGLGARDSLRLEAGYCLYGHDIDTNTSPVEAGLNWIISKQRLQDDTDTYPGKEIIKNQLEQGTEQIRVAIVSEGKAPIREGAEILNDQEQTIGRVTSGSFGPSVEKPIAMGYIDKAYTEAGTNLIVKVRDRIQKVEVVQLPFIKHRYYKGDNKQ